ncbi:MAG: hypothetical protein DRG31_02960 [Deltaproteobacteria bacterium]|nr:MAG: hypothetical protein DRG31_02960 [Deltaproteobacteria bacterium]
MTVREVCEATAGRLLQGDPEVRVCGVSTDSRTLKPGQIFFALKGPRFDGHSFVEEARRKGASGAVIERELRQEGGFPLIRVDSTLVALSRTASYWRQRLKGRIIGITGSCGKTTTREMIAQILLSGGKRVFSSPKNYNNHIGLPLSLLSASSEHEVVVLEMGMSAPGELSHLSRIARPDIGVLTNIGPVHLERFRDIRGIQEAKAEILEGMGPDSILVYNADDPLVEEIAKRFRGSRVSYGTSPSTLVRARDMELSPHGTSLLLEGPFGRLRVQIRVPGDGGIYCSLAASAVAHLLGIDPGAIQEGLEAFLPPPMRMRVKRIGDIRVIEDAYNSNPMALRSALLVLSRCEGRKIAVLGDMAELGRWTPHYHREAGRWCAELGIDHLFLLGEWSSFVAEGARQGGFKGEIFMAGGHAELASSLREFLHPGDWVLVKGSRRMEMEKVIEALEEVHAL